MILETLLILFDFKDVKAILNKKYLIVIQSKYIAEKLKEKAKWFILKIEKKINQQKNYFIHNT